MSKFKVVGEEKVNEVDAENGVDAVQKVRPLIDQKKVLEVDVRKKVIYVKEVVNEA